MESFTLGLMRGDGAPLYRQLYRHIVEEIASGGLAAGEKLPSKRRLAADLRVSVSTARSPRMNGRQNRATSTAARQVPATLPRWSTTASNMA